MLLPPFFVGRMGEPETLVLAVWCFLSFSFVSSAVCVLNDLLDVEHDRRHPQKRNRPLARGDVPLWVAWALVILLVAGGVALACRAQFSGAGLLLLCLYFLMNVAYSVRLKHAPIVDIFILASGFVFRVFYGGCYFAVPISSWLFLCVFSAALFFATGKRKRELAASAAVGGETRPVLRRYNYEFLNLHYYLFCALTVVFYCLWTISRTDQHAVGKLALTIPVMIFIVIRYNYLLEVGDSDGDPVPTLLHDRPLVLASVLFVMMNAAILYAGEYLPRIIYYVAN